MFLKNRLIITTILSAVLLSTLSYTAYFFPWLHSIVLIVCGSITFYVTLKKTEYGLLILLAELFIGSQGHFFTVEPLSLRMVLFLAVFSSWIIKLITKKEVVPKNTPLLLAYGIFMVSIGAGIINGFFQHPVTLVYPDANGWLFFLLFIIFLSLPDKKIFLEKSVSVLLASVLFLASATTILFVGFSSGMLTRAGTLYDWLRDFRIAEITHITENIYRIFIQSQLFLVIGFLIIITVLYFYRRELSRQQQWFLIATGYLSGLSILISQSRSFWLGLVAALGVWIFILLIKKIITWKKTAIIGLLLIVIFFSQAIILQMITGSDTLIFNQRITSDESMAANNSRINQLQPLITAINVHPLIGHGFGKTITYRSDDPRVLERYPDGNYTTYAFEWGYFDIILKIGLFGLILYGLLAWNILKSLFIQTKNQPMLFGLIAGAIALGTIHMFTPYLNHPLGIGYLALLGGLIDSQNN